MRIKQKELMPKLEPTVKDIIQKLSSSRTQPFRIVQRARIIELLAQGKPILEIAKEVKLHRNRITVWRTRFIVALLKINETKFCLTNQGPERRKNSLMKNRTAS